MRYLCLQTRDERDISRGGETGWKATKQGQAGVKGNIEARWKSRVRACVVCRWVRFTKASRSG